MQDPKNRLYWTAHVRGGEHPKLTKAGFVSFYPALDDYVWLEVKPENQKFLKKQTEYGISFLKNKQGWITVTHQELQRMRSTTTDLLVPGQKIKVVNGHCENLEGIIVRVHSTTVEVVLNGYNRTYEETLLLGDVAPLTEVSSSEKE